MNQLVTPAGMEHQITKTVDVLVIGAGMSGLCAGAEVQRRGRSAVIIDKGRGIGGRMATRRIGGATVDHGAQFLTARDARFAKLLEDAREAGAADEWCRGFGEKSGSHPRWRGVPGMSSLAKHLAVGLNIILEKQVTALRPNGDRWIVMMADGGVWSANAVILTSPVPQSLLLLAAGDVLLEPQMHQRLSGIQYERCLAVMAVLDGPANVPPPGGFAPQHGPIAWIADNHQKGVSVEPAVTIHATDAFSVAHWDEDRDATARQLLEAAGEWIGAGIKAYQIHGWRYSKPLQTFPNPCAVVCNEPPLVLAGDAFAGPRLEGAAVSGWAAAAALPALRNGFANRQTMTVYPP